MKNIGVIGYGVIGKRVADAVNIQDDMNLLGICDIIIDWRIQNAVRKGYPIYSATAEAAKELINQNSKSKISTSQIICR